MSQHNQPAPDGHVADFRASSPLARRVPEDLLVRVCAEYVEMPGMRLTPRQAQRLWALDPETCAAILMYLVDVGFLVETGEGTYVRLTDGPVAFPPFRTIRAASALPADARRPA